MILRRRSGLQPGLTPDEAAARWIVRVQEGDLDEAERGRFESWRSASLANVEALARAERVMALFDDASGDTHLTALRQSAVRAGAQPRRGPWLVAGAATAVLLLASVFVPVMFARQDAWRLAQSAPTNSAPDRGEFATAKGERRTVRLADGSQVTLNTDSVMQVAYSPQRRLIRLVRGQFLFNVAKNQGWPFVVQAGDREVTALGTVFEVRLEPRRVSVTLVEGKVVVDGRDDGGNGRGPITIPTMLVPGQELTATVGAAQQLAAVDLDQRLRWRDGVIELNGVTLQDALAEMNRYSHRRLVVSDPSIGRLRLSGVFRTGDPERFAAIVGELLPVKARSVTATEIELIGDPVPKW